MKLLSHYYVFQFTDDLAKECNDIGLIATTESTSNIRNFEVDPFNGFLFWIKDYESNDEKVIF